MFDFEKLEVYKKAKHFNKSIKTFLRTTQVVDPITRRQLSRASLSIVLNIAEGTSRFSKADKRNMYVISRGSAFECVAALDCLLDEEVISQEQFREFYGKADELSRMLFKMIGNLSAN